ncbi:hypothetical protein IAG44_41300 [Streptomyces roseirectus]|uniref:Uncharacterized protein n=1 Tax=Streptomyces roseirectus TaxID=2768066 RepID=A0A7H0IQZ9_9ACTN|nr:hypothetical protein [Streptomyces roseirectus]QNP75215.1 hypothetical protein IAG44_41300 [Streptomyces roseirectus]
MRHAGRPRRALPPAGYRRRHGGEHVGKAGAVPFSGAAGLVTRSPARRNRARGAPA